MTSPMHKLACFVLLIFVLASQKLHAQPKAKYPYKVERIVSDTLAYLQGGTSTTCGLKGKGIRGEATTPLKWRSKAIHFSWGLVRHT